MCERETINLNDLPNKIQWHPAFYAATSLELNDNKEELEYRIEYNLSKEPIRIDILIVRITNKTATMHNEIGHIMRTYNVIEYKSPDDALTIDSFYKTVGYACLYKGYGKKVNEIPLEEMSVSIFREGYPWKLFDELKIIGFEIKERYPGIYYLTENTTMFPAVQIVVISQLSQDKHSSLRILSKHVKKEDVKLFLKEAEKYTEKEDRDNIDAVLQASISANYDLYESVREEYVMCEALERLMHDKIEEKVNIGMREGRKESNLAAIKNIMKKLSFTAEQAMDLLEIPESQRKMMISQL